MPRAITTNSTYQKLLTDIRIELARGLKKIEELLERQKVISYWTMGGKINAYLNSHDQPRGGKNEFNQQDGV